VAIAWIPSRRWSWFRPRLASTRSWSVSVANQLGSIQKREGYLVSFPTQIQECNTCSISGSSHTCPHLLTQCNPVPGVVRSDRNGAYVGFLVMTTAVRGKH